MQRAGEVLFSRFPAWPETMTREEFLTEFDRRWTVRIDGMASGWEGMAGGGARAWRSARQADAADARRREAMAHLWGDHSAVVETAAQHGVRISG